MHFSITASLSTEIEFVETDVMADKRRFLPTQTRHEDPSA
jgi:hypothetical protein